MPRPPVPRALFLWVLSAAVMLGLAPTAGAQLQEQNVLLVFNSQQPESQAVRDMYVAHHPGVHELDLNSTALGTAGVSRTNYLNLIRGPIKDFINGVSTGEDLSQEIMCIVTTRGLPVQVNGANEFQIWSTWASVESELTVLQQDLEAAGQNPLTFRYSGLIDNPYHQRLNQPITGFSRSGIQTPRQFNLVNGPAWKLSVFSPGDIYLVCRIDAAPTDDATALENIQALLDRSQNLTVPRCGVQALLDEYADGDQLDDDAILPEFPANDDYSASKSVLVPFLIDTRHNQNADFVEGQELADQTKPVFFLGTYGENHDADGSSEDPPGQGTYFETYDFLPGAIVTSIESFNGNSIINGNQRGGQAQVLDFISAGASFTVGHIREPFTIFIEDNEFLLANMLEHGLTFAEAVYTALPALSWQNVPVGDPLATITLIDEGPIDRNADGALDLDDLYLLSSNPVDLDCDTDFDADDATLLRDLIRAGEPTDVDTR